MYKIMFSDLDETLLVNHRVPAFNQEAITKARQKGLKFVPCTGRAFFMIGEILEDLGLQDQVEEYSLCFNGGMIVENKDQNVLYFNGIGYDKCLEMFEYARDLDVCVLIFTTKCCYIFHPDENEIQRKIQQKAKFEVIDDYDMSFLKDQQIAKILFEKTDMDALKAIVEKMPSQLKDTVSVAYSSNRYIEFNALGVNKGAAMEWLANYLGVDIQDTIGIGDNYNDVDMIKTAGLGCAVSCAPDDIKALASYVTKLNYDQGAVKEVIEKFILEED